MKHMCMALYSCKCCFMATSSYRLSAHTDFLTFQASRISIRRTNVRVASVVMSLSARLWSSFSPLPLYTPNSQGSLNPSNLSSVSTGCQPCRLAISCSYKKLMTRKLQCKHKHIPTHQDCLVPFSTWSRQTDFFAHCSYYCRDRYMLG